MQQADQSNDANRQRFAMRTTEGLQSNMTMSEGIAMACGNKDIISIMKKEGYEVDHVVEPLAPSMNLRLDYIASSLENSSTDAGYALLPIQIKAVRRIVHRPMATMNVTRQTRWDWPTTTTFSTPMSDLSSPVILDMPTGTGKTITALLGSILFAIERKAEIESVQPDSITAIPGTSDVPGVAGKYPPPPVVTGNCIVFTPRHLVQHWVDHGAIAKRIVEGMTFQDGSTWSVRLVQNKYLSQEQQQQQQVVHNEVLVNICDSSVRGVKRLEPSVYYSSVCFDEAGEKNAKVNAMLQIMEPHIMHGRVLICSANFEKWVSPGMFTVKVNTVMRYIFRDWEGEYKGLGVAATCSAAAVFSEQERAGAMTESTLPLESTLFNTATVTYKPSLVERVVGGYGVDLGDDIGCDVFEKKYGVHVSECSTVTDVLNAITDEIGAQKKTLDALEGQENTKTYRYSEEKEGEFVFPRYKNPRSFHINMKIEELEDLMPKIEACSLVADDCPICLEPMRGLTFFQPCLHCACKHCHGELSGTCPMCTRDMRGGTVGVSSYKKRPLRHVPFEGSSDGASDSSLGTGEGGSSSISSASESSLGIGAGGASSVSGASESSLGTSAGDSSIASSSSSSSVDIDEKAILPSDARIGDLFCDEMASLCGENEPGGVIQAMYNTVAAVQKARSKTDRADQTLRTMIICPGVDMRDGGRLFEGLGFEVLHFKTSGTKQSPVTRKRMDSCMDRFKATDGKSKLLFVCDAGHRSTKDRMTGLDVNGLDCVVAVGSGNFAQRVGRLCRLSRVSLPEKEKHALYVEIVPNEEIRVMH